VALTIIKDEWRRYIFKAPVKYPAVTKHKEYYIIQHLGNFEVPAGENITHSSVIFYLPDTGILKGWALHGGCCCGIGQELVAKYALHATLDGYDILHRWKHDYKVAVAGKSFCSVFDPHHLMGLDIPFNDDSYLQVHYVMDNQETAETQTYDDSTLFFCFKED